MPAFQAQSAALRPSPLNVQQKKMATYQSLSADHPAVRSSGLEKFRGESWWLEFADGAAARAIGKRKDGRHVLLDLQLVQVDQRFLVPADDDEEVRKQFATVWSELARRYKAEGD